MNSNTACCQFFDKALMVLFCCALNLWLGGRNVVSQQPAIDSNDGKLVVPKNEPASPPQAEKDPTAMRLNEIDSRLLALEQRLTKIEEVLFASVRYSKAEAERELNRAKLALQYSQRLHAKGLLTGIQLKIDGINLQRAKMLLRLCVDEQNHRLIGAKLDVFDAQKNLEIKRMQYDYSAKVYERGLIAKSEIESDQEAVELAEKRLQVADEKLKSLEK